MHVSTLFSGYSCGSFGESAKYFIDFLKKGGFTYWQTLPFCMVDECNSPYKSYSAFGANPYFIDLEKLHNEGLLDKEDLEKARENTPYTCEYERLKDERFLLLKKASVACKKRAEIEEFIEGEPYLKKCCEFMALKQQNDEKQWNEWEETSPDDELLFAWKFIQYEFFTQWQEIKAYANENGIKIIGDVPIYVSYDSADVWGDKELFLLGEDNLPTKVAGVPPDYFCADGQLWGNPLYDWDRMKKDGYKWWKDRLSHILNIFDGVRIDHFRAFSEYWSVDFGEKTAKNGRWETGPRKSFIDAVKEVSKDRLIIAEDLGDISKEVYELLEYSGFPGMRVLQFGFLGDDDSTHIPHNYVKNCVAYTGTHDNNTLLGYVWELGEKERNRLIEYAGFMGEDWNKCYDSLIRMMFSSSAGLLILPIQDLLGYGADTRLNIPGKAKGNWGFRITKQQLDSIDVWKYFKLNQLYKRI